MLKSLLELTKQVLGLTKDTEQNKADIKALQQQVEQLTAAVQHLAFELQRQRESSAYENRMLRLELENALLKFERRLPPGNKQGEEQE